MRIHQIALPPFSIEWLRLLRIGLAALVLEIAAPITVAESAEEKAGSGAATVARPSAGGDHPRPGEGGDGAFEESLVDPADRYVCHWVFENGENVIAVRRQLETLLRRRIELLDRACRLTDAQKRKLELAGRGDMHRLFDRMHEIGGKMEHAANDERTRDALVREAEGLRRGLIEAGSTSEVPLFVKSLEKTLTAEQLTHYQPLRAVFWAGGLIQPAGHGQPHDALKVDLARTGFTDDGLAHLSGLQTLHSLCLDRTRVTDEGLIHLTGLARLESLTLDHTRISDAGLVHLKDMTSLRCLSLSGTWVSDAGLVHLKDLSGLRELTLDNTNLNGKGLSQLKGLSGLTDLRVRNTCVTDTGLTHISELTGLEWLWLGETQVSDAGLANLTGPASLKCLFVGGASVTYKGIHELKRAWPTLSINNGY